MAPMCCAGCLTEIVDNRSADDDESVASFVGRHFNNEVVDRLADPLLAAVYGGDCSVLSARAANYR